MHIDDYRCLQGRQDSRVAGLTEQMLADFPTEVERAADEYTGEGEG